MIIIIHYFNLTFLLMRPRARREIKRCAADQQLPSHFLSLNMHLTTGLLRMPMIGKNDFAVFLKIDRGVGSRL